MIIPVWPCRQWTRYSCSAAVLQMGIRHVTGQRLNHLAAIRLTECQPDGCTLARLQSVFRKQGARVRSVRLSVRVFSRVLDDGHLIVAGDTLSWREDHVILVIGYTANRFWIIDPIIGLATLRAKRFVVLSADSAFEIGGA